ncbi:MAG TPA: copper resistance protein CopC [Stellaceae bacterium]|jgi:hypothetical protein|nr:copper resistance protein CopC [Stellaceae bacterium]
MRYVLALIVLAAVGLPSDRSYARAFLDRAVPAAGGAVDTVPKEIRLIFSEAIEPMFSGASLTTASGKVVATENAAADPQDSKQLVLPLPSLPPGRYRVRWHVVSANADRSEGSFEFEIQP